MNYDKFNKLCKSKGTTPTALTLKLGLSKGNASSWKKNGNPSVDILIKISKELDCSVDYLLDLTDDPSPPNKELTLDEEVAAEYYKMSADEREQLKEYMQFLKIKKTLKTTSQNGSGEFSSELQPE